MTVTYTCRQAITVRYLGPTETQGARWVARADSGRAVTPYDYGLNPGQNAEAAAEALCVKLGWAGDLVGGQAHDGSYVFVFTGGE